MPKGGKKKGKKGKDKGGKKKEAPPPPKIEDEPLTDSTKEFYLIQVRVTLAYASRVMQCWMNLKHSIYNTDS